MTTDTTELALLISKAKASVFTLEYISQFEPADIDSDDVDLRFEVDGRDTGTNVSIVDECRQGAKVIGELVEALEKAQQYGKERDAENQDLMLTVGRLRVEREELESRTVKLPDDEDGQAYGFGKWANGKLPATAGTMTIAYCEDAWRAAFEVFSSAAGIKVEGE